ncbi:hypothetical protein [Streptomyces sp. NPDC001658]
MRNVMTTLLERAAERGEIPTAEVSPRIMNRRRTWYGTRSCCVASR